VIAVLVLLPEAWAASRAAHADRLQTSMNLAFGSALASIGLTVPVVVLAELAALNYDQTRDIRFRPARHCGAPTGCRSS
jgi:Ca2+/H+ antiporter